MKSEKVHELLCFDDTERMYGISLSSVKEICYEKDVTKVPCLPEYFCGVYNYRGRVIPVASPKGFETPGKNGDRKVLLVVRSGFGMFGIQIYGNPSFHLIPESSHIRSSGINDGIWSFGAVYGHEDRLVYEMDLEKTVRGLMEFQ